MNEDRVFMQRCQNLQRHPLCQCLEYCYLVTGLWTMLLNFPRTLQHISIGSVAYHLISEPIRSPTAQKNMQTTESHTAQQHTDIHADWTREVFQEQQNAQWKTGTHSSNLSLNHSLYSDSKSTALYLEHLCHRMTYWMTTHWLTAFTHPRVLRTINHHYRQRCLSRQSGNITSDWCPSSILNVHNCTSQEHILQNNNGSHIRNYVHFDVDACPFASMSDVIKSSSDVMYSPSSPVLTQQPVLLIPLVSSRRRGGTNRQPLVLSTRICCY